MKRKPLPCVDALYNAAVHLEQSNMGLALRSISPFEHCSSKSTTACRHVEQCPVKLLADLARSGANHENPIKTEIMDNMLDDPNRKKAFIG